MISGSHDKSIPTSSTTQNSQARSSQHSYVSTVAPISQYDNRPQAAGANTHPAANYDYNYMPPSNDLPQAPGPTIHHHTTSTAAYVQYPEHAALMQPQQQQQNLEAREPAPVQDTFELSDSIEPLMQRPGPLASTEERIDFLQQQLDSFGVVKPMFDDLVSLGSGSNERRQGGALKPTRDSIAVPLVTQFLPHPHLWLNFCLL